MLPCSLFFAGDGVAIVGHGEGFEENKWTEHGTEAPDRRWELSIDRKTGSGTMNRHANSINPFWLTE